MKRQKKAEKNEREIMKNERRVIKEEKRGEREKIKENGTGRENRRLGEWRQGVQMKGRGTEACFIHSPLTLL